MIPTQCGTREFDYWVDQLGAEIVRASHISVFTAPSDPPDCLPCQAVVTYPTEAGGAPVVRVAWKPDEIDLARLAHGGTIWLSCWGGLPAHALEVQAP